MMRRSTKRGLLIIVFVFSTTQFMYFYFHEGSSSRYQKLRTDLYAYQGNIKPNGTVSQIRLAQQDNHIDKPTVQTSDSISEKMSKRPLNPPQNSSGAVYPPLLYNMEMYFHSPYRPLLHGKQRRKEGFMTIGIPSVKRPNTDKVYIFETIASLIENTKESEKSEITIVIYMCDNNATFNKIISEEIFKTYQNYCDSGFIHVIQGNQDIYPDLSRVQTTFNDPIPRIKWRAKQNIDFAYLTLYCKNLSKYYLQLEDDVITASDYAVDIQKFIDSQKKPWFLLEFSNLGFIGKLFHSMDLDRVAFYLLSFYDRAPGDLLLGHIRKLMNQDKPIHTKKSLFQHIGKFSSLKDKLMPSVDKDFKDAGSVHLSINDIPMGDNPAAKILTSLAKFDVHEPANAYDNTEKFFWARDIKKNQHFTLLFQKPQQISRIIIATGNQDTKADSILKGSVHLAVRRDIGESPSDLKDCGEFKKLTDLVGGDVDTKALGLESKIPADIICLQVKVDKNQKSWVIFRNISVMIN